MSGLAGRRMRQGNGLLRVIQGKGNAVERGQGFRVNAQGRKRAVALGVRVLDGILACAGWMHVNVHVALGTNVKNMELDVAM
ncbi:MAG: hypothetical protein AAGU77_13500, partial [Bacillota bacterium]